jgi:hypothetical protein
VTAAVLVLAAAVIAHTIALLVLTAGQHNLRRRLTRHGWLLWRLNIDARRLRKRYENHVHATPVGRTLYPHKDGRE